MGNVSGRSDGEGTSGVKPGEEYDEQLLGSSRGGICPEPLNPAVFLPKYGEMMANQSLEFLRKMNYEVTHHEKRTPVMITWNHGGKQVAIAGSWDNWGTTELMQRSGKEFNILKVLPSGIYHYHFIVDGQVKYAPDLPCDFGDPVSAYNVLDVKEHVEEACQSESEVACPASPNSSYSRDSPNDIDFSKPPPDLPPHLHRAMLNESLLMDHTQYIARPHHVALNHLYMKSCDHGQAVALGSTHRFLEKYVMAILYKPSWRHR